MRIFTKQFIILGVCLTLILTLFLGPVIAAKPDRPPNPNKPDNPDNPGSPPTLDEQVQAELDYITNSSWTEENKNSNSWQFFDPTDDIYGAINANRIPKQGAPNRFGWVRPGEGAMAMVGMMQGTTYLYNNQFDIAKYDSMIDKFFLSWELAHQQGQNNDPITPDYGAFMERVDYNASGKYATVNPKWKTDVTAQIMIVNWKYYEYNVKTNQTQQATDWLNKAWPLQQKAVNYLVRMHDTTPAEAIHLLPGNSSQAEYTAWIHFAANAVPALRAASAWAKKMSVPYTDYDRVADDLVIGIQSMKDLNRPNYFRYRSYENGSYGVPTYGESIDQFTFVPYETGAIPLDNFAGEISDWWTNGDGEIKMTYQTSDPADWRYFGIHWHYYFDGRAENNQLNPGPGFQLAKVEWKYGKTAGNEIYTGRSANRLTWGKSLNYSSLWWFLTGQVEAGVPNGFQDWRDAINYSNTAETWARFVDSSAYFIEALLMNEAGIDIDYNPILL